MSFFSDLAAVLEQDAAKTVLPVIAADLADVQAHAADYLNPLTQPAKLIKLQADILSVLPTLNATVVSDVAGLLVAYVQKVQQPVAQAAAPKTA
jgi:hypothetical protein